MSVVVGTHSGTFHADDVVAFALVTCFVDGDALLVRSRDQATLDACDIVVDVGGRFEASEKRFDHHQASYTGPRSSAGMVLDWLMDTAVIDAPLEAYLRARLVEYIDDVDVGRVAPKAGIPCFPSMVALMNERAQTPEQKHTAFLRCASFIHEVILGLRQAHESRLEATQAVLTEMNAAQEAGRSVLFFDRYYPWKEIYFAHGGETHPTAFVLFPSDGEKWKIVTIPPQLGQFEQKVSLPQSWAGKLGDDLEEATGVSGSLFCHKNRFIAVFKSRDGALDALKRFNLYDGAVVGASA